MTERTTFNDLGLIAPILTALREEGYDTPTPIQARAIPHLLHGRDLLGCAQTGTGKTAAFAIPILQELHQRTSPVGRRFVKCLVLTPTRELAIQIGESFANYGRHLALRHTVVFGGVGQKPQTDALARGVDILVATPGRLLDLMGQGFVDLRQLEVFVLDEADRMLDMGFIHDVKKVIAKLPPKRQTLLFSATMPLEIAKLAHGILTNPVKVEVAPPATTVESVDQCIYFVDRTDKNALLAHLLKDPAIREVLVFTRTKHGANKVAKLLAREGIGAEAIHGNKSQSARQTALKNFKEGRTRVLVATDIAARGIDIDGLGHVLNFDLPNVPETYVHRIGRTGRAGAEGRAISFCDHEEKAFLRDIIKVIRREIPVVTGHAFEMNGGPKKAAPEPREARQHSARTRSGPSPQQQRRKQVPGDAQRRGAPERPGQGRTHGRQADEHRADRKPSRSGGSGRTPRRPEPGHARGGPDRRPGGDRQVRGPKAPARNNYTDMARELFGDGDATPAAKPQEQAVTRKGFGLGRLFGR